jgi:hypothetical protein
VFAYVQLVPQPTHTVLASHEQKTGAPTMTMMIFFLVAFASLAAVSEARTTVAVLELGKGGTVRRTTSTNAQTTVAGVASFWSSLHGGIHHMSLQHAGHTVVPDLFNRADGGVVIGLTNVDLSAMPTLTNLIEEESPSNRVVGHLELDGAMSRPLLQKVGIAEETTEESLQSAATIKSKNKGLSAMHMHINEENASTVDTNVASMVQSLHKEALEQDRTIVLHLVVEEEEGSSRRRLAASPRRRLEEEGAWEQNVNVVLAFVVIGPGN